MKLIFVRHGQTTWNKLRRFQGRTDIPLNPVGKEQVRKLAVALSKEKVKACYTSPLTRAVETVEQIRIFHPSAPLRHEPQLIEMDLGDFEGMDVCHWVEKHQTFKDLWDKHPANLKMPNGESLLDVQERSVAALLNITESHKHDETIVICSHNFVIVSLLCYFDGISLDQFRTFRQDTAALNIVYKKGDHFMLDKVNESSHLQ